jgi:hypothetical protein
MMPGTRGLRLIKIDEPEGDVKAHLAETAKRAGCAIPASSATTSARRLQPVFSKTPRTCVLKSFRVRIADRE